ncbi:MAG: hypothetical protein ACI8UO_006793, partial [Verrucomicrobiales bacterium]
SLSPAVDRRGFFTGDRDVAPPCPSKRRSAKSFGDFRRVSDEFLCFD